MYGGYEATGRGAGTSDEAGKDSGACSVFECAIFVSESSVKSSEASYDFAAYYGDVVAIVYTWACAGY